MRLKPSIRGKGDKMRAQRPSQELDLGGALTKLWVELGKAPRWKGGQGSRAGLGLAGEREQWPFMGEVRP